MSATQPPDHLAEVFQYLARRRTIVARSRQQGYAAFQSSYYTFRGAAVHANANVLLKAPRTAPGTAVVAPVASAAPLRAATPLAEVSRQQPVSVVGEAAQVATTPLAASARRASSPLAAVSPTPRVVEEEPFHTPKAPAQLTRSPPPPRQPTPPPPLPAASTPSGRDPLPSFKRKVPPPALSVPQQRLSLSDRPRVADLDDSVGSIELPTEQQPDGEFLSPMSRHEFVSCSLAPLSSAATPVHPASTSPSTMAKSRGLSSAGSGGRGRRQSSNASTAKAEEEEEGLSAHEPSEQEQQQQQMLSDTSRSSTHTAFFASAARHVSIAEPTLVKEVRSCSMASMLERRASPVFVTERSLQTFPGLRRVSLRRPIFDTDDDVN